MSVSNPEDAELLNSGTPVGLYKFLDLAMKRGDIPQPTGVALRVGSKKVVDIDGDDQLDLRNLDQDDLLRRFHIKSKVDLNDKSRATYEGRFRKAVSMYLKYLDNDPTWKPKPRASTSKTTSRAKMSAPTPSVDDTPDTTDTSAVTPPATSPGPGMIEFPIPLRPGVQGKLILPDDLTKREAERVVKVVSALAIEEQLAITAGPSTS